MMLQSKLLGALLGRARCVRFFSTTPPREGTAPPDIESAAARFLGRIGTLDLDGLIVYDVQDEAERTSQPRPFAFQPALDTRAYAQVLESLGTLPVVTYKCIGNSTEPEWERWLDHSRSQFNTSLLALVGRASSRASSQASSRGAGHDSGAAISLAQATKMASERGFCVGGVAIAERHSAQRSESHRLIQKARDGARFFTSQAVYEPQATIRMLRDYAADCRELGISPQRIVLTFTPCGSERTLGFLRWLGVAIDDEIERDILSASDPLARSIEICRASLLRILSDEQCRDLPLGINVESVSSKKEEAEAAATLSQVLALAARQH